MRYSLTHSEGHRGANQQKLDRRLKSNQINSNSNGDQVDVPVNHLDQLMQFVQENIERLNNSNRLGMAQIESIIQNALTKMEEENNQIRIWMEEKLREAETSIAHNS